MFVPVVYAMFVLATAVFLLLCEWPSVACTILSCCSVDVLHLLTVTVPVPD